MPWSLPFQRAIHTCIMLMAFSNEAISDSPLSISNVFTTTHGWTIGNNESIGGCLAAASYRDGTTAWVGFDGQGGGLIAFTNSAWRSIEPGRPYKIELRAGGHTNWFGMFTGVERSKEKGIISTDVKLDFLTDFARADGIGIFLDGTTIAKLSLDGSSAALEAVASCRRSLEESADPSKKSPPSGSAGQFPGTAASESTSESSGTGFFVSPAEHVLTAQHVIDGCSRI